MEEPLRLNNSEIRLMELIWEQGTLPARQLYHLAQEALGWNKNTTYTVLGGLVRKGAVLREDPGFLCTPLVSAQQVRRQETRSHIDRFYKGSLGMFFSSFLERETLSPEELEQLRQIIREKSEG